MTRIRTPSTPATPRPVSTEPAPAAPKARPVAKTAVDTGASSFESAPRNVVRAKVALFDTPSRAPAPGSYPSRAQIDRILAMDDAVARNYAITQSYHDLSQAFGSLVGTENANWTTYAVWASRQAGVSIRKEDAPKLLVDALEKSADFGAALEHAKQVLGPFGGLVPPVSGLLSSGDLALDLVSNQIGEGNKQVFAEISREFSRFIDTFGGDTAADPAKLQAYLATFPAEQAVLRDGMEAYAKAMFEQDPEKKAELMFLGNACVGLHEQRFLQTYIERALNAPVDAIVRENLEDAIGATLPGKLLKKAGLLDDALDPLVNAIGAGVRRVVTEHMMSLPLPNQTLKLGEDVVGPNGTPFPDALKTIENPELQKVLADIDTSPDSLKGSAARDWVRLSDRMNFIVDLFRSYQQDPSMFGQPFDKPVTLGVA